MTVLNFKQKSECCSWYLSIIKPQTRNGFEALFGNETVLVEPQGVEPWSREDGYVRSTCLVDFDCREEPGRQQPSPSLVAVVSTVARNNATAQFVLSTPLVQARGTKAWAMMASCFLSRIS
jgi:hypothetical protein